METIESGTVEASYSYEEFIAKLGLKVRKGHGSKRTEVLEPEQSGTTKLQTTSEGGRNTALTSLAGTLRRRGMPADLMRSVLLTQNQLVCKPPLPEDEVERIASSVGRYEPQPSADIATTLTDTGNAERFEQNWKDCLRYVPKWKRWLLWDGTRWVKDDSSHVVELAKETARRIYEEGVGLPDENVRISIAKHSARSLQAERLKAMINLATSIPSLVAQESQLDADPMLLGVVNGVLDLRTGELQPAKPEDLITKQSPVQFDPAAKCPRFEAFVQEIMNENEELIAYLRRVMGYCLTGLTEEQCLFFFYGSGANGKSTFLNVMKDVLGDDYCKQTPSETLMVKKNGRNSTNDIARLVGVRSVLSNEVEEGSRLSESFIKEMTGGDQISARFLYAEYFEFRPEFKIIIAGNHQPVIRGDDTGIWRRLHMVPFTVTIPAERRDPKLAETLRAELPGILNWALAGCLEWQRQRLNQPKLVTDAVAEYRSDMDVLGQWIEDRCELGDDRTAGATDAYQSYKFWAESNGFSQMSNNAFGRKLKERFIRKATSTGKVYLGLRVIPGRGYN